MHGRAILTTILLRVSTSSDDRRLTFFAKKPIRIMIMIETMIILKSMQSTNNNKFEKIVSFLNISILDNLIKIFY